MSPSAGEILNLDMVADVGPSEKMQDDDGLSCDLRIAFVSGEVGLKLCFLMCSLVPKAIVLLIS